MIKFNQTIVTGNELVYINEVIQTGRISGDGVYTKKCHEFLQNRYFFNKCLFTTSCTDALEMASILIDIKPGDEVIMPSYTFVSTANAFVLRGAKINFIDSSNLHPGMNEELIEDLITENTKAIVVVHYAGVACNMAKIKSIANKYNLFVIEDAAQAIDSYYIDENNEYKALGGIGDLGTYSFHETKNITCGEGGMLIINNQKLSNRAEIIREKGTNRASFFRGEVDKYGWVDIGSSFLSSDILAAYLFAQLESIDLIQTRRKQIWNKYFSNLIELQNIGKLKLPFIPDYATNNGHMFYIVCKNLHERTELISFLQKNEINSVFHYLSLHKSQFYKSISNHLNLFNSDMYTDCLVRLPLYYDLKDNEIDYITNKIFEFYND